MSNIKIEQENLKDIHDKIGEIEGLGSLKMWMLHVLEHGPKNGVEIMDAVEEHHERFYQMKESMHPSGHDNQYKNIKKGSKRPLPGSVYPMLKNMVKENLIVKRSDGKYKITEDGLEIVYKIFGFSKNPQDEINRGKALNYALNEISKCIFYLEDVPVEQIFYYKDLIANLAGRLKKIQYSVENG